jgi:alkaline phosphatase D
MLNRRQILAGGAASLFAAPAILKAQSLWRHHPFSLGVASGDPAPDGFVIWTRIAPEPLSPDGGVGIGVAPVKWEVASDDRFRDIVARGEALARPELAHSVHVEVSGLQPDRPYWYRFEVQGERSIRGRARTLPAPGATPSALRFGVAGCQNYEEGYYTAFRHLAREELAFVYHYGDYIYEYGGDPVRPSFSGDIIEPVRQHAGSRNLYDIDDYRMRYAQVKMDADLQRAHAAHSFLTSLDDHEVENNWVGILPQTDVPPEIFRLRRAQAFQAWYEHMPVRRASLPRPDGMQVYRSLRWGNLAEIDLLDTRQYRTDQPCNDRWAPCDQVGGADAAVLGAEQEAWLNRNLASRDTRWNVIAQQVMMMSLDRRREPDEAPAKVVNTDSWAGYEVPRQRLLARMAGLDNVVVLTGDEHQNFAGLLHDARGRPVAAEIVATSISSGGDGWDQRNGSAHILASNPQLKFINSQRGYVLCDLNVERCESHFMVMDQVRTPGGQISRRATATIPHGEVDMTIAAGAPA